MFTLKAREGDVIDEIKSTLHNESEINWVRCFLPRRLVGAKRGLEVSKTYRQKRTPVTSVI
ncbi:hypothetical protein BPJM79_10109 [Bacillus pumilus]